MKARGVPTKDFTVRLPEELAEVLRNYAFVSNLSVNEIFKRAVSDYLQTHGRREAVAAAFDRVLQEHGVALEKLKNL